MGFGLVHRSPTCADKQARSLRFPSAMRMNVNTPFAYSLAEAAARARVGRATVFEEIRTGRLRAVKLGRRTLILPGDLRDWPERLPPINPRDRDETPNAPQSTGMQSAIVRRQIPMSSEGVGEKTEPAGPAKRSNRESSYG